jgi:polar amino acid transport system substrate-binding protein
MEQEAQSQVEQRGSETVHEPRERGLSRRNLIRTGSAMGVAGVGAWAIAACSGGSGGSTASGQTTVAPPASGTGTGSSILDKIVKDGKAKIGVDLTFPPIQFRDANNEPTGYNVELFKLMLKDLKVEPDWVDIPFANLFSAQASGQIDLSGIAATILPSRALNVTFASVPLFVESVVVLLKPGSTIKSTADLNNSNVTIAVQVGSSQEATAPSFFPDAKLKSLENQAAIQDVVTGRSDAYLLSEFNIAPIKKANPEVSVLKAPPVFVDYNTWFMPLNDTKAQLWITNWLSYQISHGTLATQWDKWIGNDARALGLQTIPITDTWTAAAVTLGEKTS